MRRNWLLPVLLAAVQLAIWPGAALWAIEPVDPAQAAVGIAATVMVAVAAGWRRREPVAALAGIMLALTIGQLSTPSDSLVVISAADMIALYSITVWRQPRTAFIAIAALAGWQSLLSLAIYEPGREYFGNLIPAIAFYLLAVGFGRARRRWHDARQAAADQLARTEADRQRSSVLERQRLARELHDISAHHLTSIVVSMTAARRLADRRPELAAEALAFATHSGAETLSALERLVSVLRGVERDSQSPLRERIEDLVAGFVRLGQPVSVSLNLESAGEAVPAAVEGVAYGIVREALTNTLRHAPGAPVRVRLEYRDSSLEVLVENGKPLRHNLNGAASVGSGQGLAGMRERVADRGGVLATGPRVDGGWLVRAVLPASHPRGPATHRSPNRPRLVDIAIAVAVAVFPVSVTLLADAGDALSSLTTASGALLALLLLGAVIPLLWRSRVPWLVLAAGLTCAAMSMLPIGFAVLPPPILSLLPTCAVAQIVAVYAVAAHGRHKYLTWISVPVTAIVLAAVTVTAAATDGSLLGQPVSPFVTVFALALTTAVFDIPLAVVWTAGFMVRWRRERLVAREKSAVALSVASAVELAQAERIRISFGLRDTVLAETALMIAAAAEGNPDRVLGAARAALAAMRELLGDLRTEAALAPQPTLAAIDGLCRSRQGFGREVRLSAPVAQPRLPLAVEVSAYRIVEAALDAGGTGPCAVTVVCGHDELRITVTGVPSAVSSPTGAGLRARVAALGGRIRLDDDGIMDVCLPTLIGPGLCKEMP